MEFRELLIRSQAGDEQSFTELLAMYRPLLMRESVVDGIFDEDLFQELCVVFLRCIKKFRI